MERSEGTEQAASAGMSPARTPAPAMDAAKYRLYLAPMQLAPEEEDRLLSTLWSMMEAFVDYGFGWERASPSKDSGDESALQDAIAAVQEESTKRLMSAFDEAATPSPPGEAPP